MTKLNEWVKFANREWKEHKKQHPNADPIKFRSSKTLKEKYYRENPKAKERKEAREKYEKELRRIRRD
jgi:Tfp pilus assembly protein PilP